MRKAMRVERSDVWTLVDPVMFPVTNALEERVKFSGTILKRKNCSSTPLRTSAS
jgi:hypothetical protein